MVQLIYKFDSTYSLRAGINQTFPAIQAFFSENNFIFLHLNYKNTK